MSNGLETKMRLGTKLISFDKFCNWLVLAQILKVIAIFYPKI